MFMNITKIEVISTLEISLIGNTSLSGNNERPYQRQKVRTSKQVNRRNKRCPTARNLTSSLHQRAPKKLLIQQLSDSFPSMVQKTIQTKPHDSVISLHAHQVQAFEIIICHQAARPATRSVRFDNWGQYLMSTYHLLSPSVNIFLHSARKCLVIWCKSVNWRILSPLWLRDELM